MTVFYFFQVFLQFAKEQDEKEAAEEVEVDT